MDPDQSKNQAKYSTEECQKCQKVEEENQKLKKIIVKIAWDDATKALGKEGDNKNNKKK